MLNNGVCSTTRSTIVVLPAPDGAETMKSRPRLLLDILHLLAHLLELGLGGDDQLGDAEAVGLRADGIDLPIHFLQQEVELSTAGFDRPAQRHPVRRVAAKPLDLL